MSKTYRAGLVGWPGGMGRHASSGFSTTYPNLNSSRSAIFSPMLLINRETNMGSKRAILISDQMYDEANLA